MSKLTRTGRLFPLDSVMDARAIATQPKRGMTLVDLKALGIVPGVMGGDRGYHAAGDIITQTTDQVDLNDLWNAYQEMLSLYNADRDRMVQFLTYPVTVAAEPYFTTGSQAQFEEATEYGEPVGYRPTQEYAFLGYTHKWWDLAGRFTWMFLAEAPSNQVDAFANMAVEADNRLIFEQVMKTLFNNTRRVNEFGNAVYPFYSGVAGDEPPTYRSTTFADLHNHYTTTNGDFTAAKVEAMYDNLAEHGYTTALGYDAVLMVNRAQGDVMRHWRSLANLGSTPVTPLNGGGLYDFIPAQGTPNFLLPDNFRVGDAGGGQPPATIQGMTVIGRYGEWLVVQEDYIPPNYLVGFVTGGPENVRNPLAFREHTNAGLRGLRLVKGRTPDYPLIDSFYNRGFGTGVKWRGAGAIMQITASGDATYEVPAEYEWSA